MTREQAIRTYVERLSGDDLVELIQHVAFYNSSFEDCIYAEDLKDDIIDHLVNSYSGDTPWETLNDIISADDDARFIDFLKLIEEEEEEG